MTYVRLAVRACYLLRVYIVKSTKIKYAKSSDMRWSDEVTAPAQSQSEVCSGIYDPNRWYENMT